MKKLRIVYTAVLVSTLVISQWSGHMDMATAASVQAATTTKAIGTMQLSSKVQASLEEVNIWPQAGGNILTYTINYTNGGSNSAGLMFYFSKVITSGGAVLTGHPVNEKLLNKSVASHGSLRATYYVNLGQSKSLQGLKFPMYVWDTNTKGYLKQAGTYTLPSNYSTTVASGTSLNTTLNDIPVTASSQSIELYKYNGKVYAKVGFNLTNRGQKVLNDPGYTAYLISGGGSTFELTLNSSQTGYKIQPQEKKTIYYLTELPSYLKMDNMKLQFTQKDETLKLELAKTSYKLPATVTPDLVVGKNVIKKILVNNNIIEMLLKNASVYAENDKGIWSFQLRLKNTGNKAVTLPAYELAVQSAKGTTFPVEAKGLSGLTLKPLEEKMIPLSVQIPLEVEQNTLKLQMIEAVSMEAASGTGTSDAVATPEVGAKLSVPIAYFTIPYTLQTDTQQGLQYRVTNTYGTFTYSLQSLQRFPWREDDILIAKLKMTNTGAVNLSLPDLKGALKLDTDDLSASTELLMDKDAAVLAPGKSTELNVLAKIPYTQKVDDLKVTLYSMEKEEKTTFLTLSTPNVPNAIKTIEQGGSYVISGKGKNAKVQENKTIVYEGANSNIIYTEMLLSSEEQRQSKMARLAAYYRTADGQLYEAASNQPDTAATPGSKQLIAFWVKLPKSVGISDVAMYLGPGITGHTFSESGQELSGYIDVSSLQLNPVKTPPQANLTQVELYPYTLSVLNSNGRALQGGDSITIDMNYNLLRDSSYDMGTFNHKLVLKMTDPYGQSQERSPNIGTDLLEGASNTYTVSFSNVIYKNLVGGTYRLTLYDEFQGERIELASQNYNLFMERADSDKK